MWLWVKIGSKNHSQNLSYWLLIDAFCGSNNFEPYLTNVCPKVWRIERRRKLNLWIVTCRSWIFLNVSQFLSSPQSNFNRKSPKNFEAQSSSVWFLGEECKFEVSEVPCRDVREAQLEGMHSTTLRRVEVCWSFHLKQKTIPQTRSIFRKTTKLTPSNKTTDPCQLWLFWKGMWHEAPLRRLVQNAVPPVAIREMVDIQLGSPVIQDFWTRLVLVFLDTVVNEFKRYKMRFDTMLLNDWYSGRIGW